LLILPVEMNKLFMKPANLIPTDIKYNFTIFRRLRLLPILVYLILVSEFCRAADNPDQNAIENIHFEVSYLGIPLLDMMGELKKNDSTTSVIYDNTLRPFADVFFDFHTVYQVIYENDSYRPLTWFKKIEEGDLVFDMAVSRDQSSSRVIYEDGQTSTIPDDAFTIFSATHYLVANAHEPGFFPLQMRIFVDGEIWLADIDLHEVIDGNRKPSQDRPELVLKAILHYESGTLIEGGKDMLSRTIARENNTFLIKVSPEGKFHGAVYGKFPRAVELKRIY